MLALKRASKHRPGGPWSDDDYDVFDGERHIGRIMLHPQALPNVCSSLPPGMRIWLIALICVVAALAVDLVWFDRSYSQAALNYFNIRYSGGGGIGISAPNLGHLWRMP